MTEYVINLSDNSDTITVPENAVDTEKTSIALVGHGQPNYGDDQNANFIHMLENFSSPKEPNMPIKGQIWFKQNDETTYDLMVCKKRATEIIDQETGQSNAEWDKLAKFTSGDQPTNPSTGDMWYDASSHQFKVFDGELTDDDDPYAEGAWNIIGPKDVQHNQEEYYPSKIPYGSTSTTYIIPSTYFLKDCYNSPSETGYTGSLHLVTLKVLIKEVWNQTSAYNIDNLRAAALIYRFVVRTLSSESGKSISILGSPNYEILAQSDNLNYDMDININNQNNIEYSVNIDSGSMIPSTYYVVGFDMDISRV